MLQSIINYINEQICELVPGAQVFGIAKTANVDGLIKPYVLETEKSVMIDDTFPFVSYHKEQSLSSSLVRGTGYGDSIGDLSNSYGMSLIVFFDEKKVGVKTEQLYTLIQARITGILKIEGYKSIRIGVANAILNDGQVWRQEYGDANFRLSASQRLIQIGYSVIVTLDKNCFPKCISNS